MKKIIWLCWQIRFVGWGGLSTGLPLLFLAKPAFGWSVNWVLLGWVLICFTIVVLSFFYKGKNS